METAVPLCESFRIFPCQTNLRYLSQPFNHTFTPYQNVSSKIPPTHHDTKFFTFSTIRSIQYCICPKNRFPDFDESSRFEGHWVQKSYFFHLFTFSAIRSIEKVLHLPKKSTSRFWWMFTFWGPLNPKKVFLACRLCVCVSVCLSVYVSVCGHHNSKNNWASSTKFGMWSYMIKISVGIAYEQNRPTGVTSALRGQFGFWAKSALKRHCTNIFKSCYKSQYATFGEKTFSIAQRVWPLS